MIGICGTAMASLAGMLVEQGHEVTGSDENVYPPMSLELARLRIPVTEGYDPANLSTPRPDVIVVGNAITRGNPELEQVLNEKLYYTSMAAVVEENFIRGHHSIVVAGTHGKTTTTSLMAWAMECAGANPSFLIGGVAENFNSSFRVTNGPYFVIEGDEYDTAYFDKGPKFMHYLPDTVILNNIEFDHADIYRDIDAVKFAFSRLINLIPSNGNLIAGSDSPLVNELAPRAFCRVERFGTQESEWVAEDISFSSDMTRFTARFQGSVYGRYVSPLAGLFNVRNCLAVIATCEALGLDRGSVAEAITAFKSVKRRLEVKGHVRGVTVIDDFAHHPTAVRETLLATRSKYPGRRIVAVFEPRSYTAQIKVFQTQFEEALSNADEIIIAGLFHPERYTAETAISPTEMTEHLKALGREAWSIPHPDDIVAKLTPRLRDSEVVVIMSNGSFGRIHEKILDALRAEDAGAHAEG